MALTKAQANDIVRVVQADSECRVRIKSFLGSMLPDSWGLAGPLRNTALTAASMGTSLWMEKEEGTAAHKFAQPYICYGIAQATTKALENAQSQGRLPGVDSVIQRIRASKPSHFASGLSMTSDNAMIGKFYVFDWWKTLVVGNPMIFRGSDWDSKRGGKTLGNFNGYA